ncbi:MAP kinase [Dissoconium aciculare CBS 342.82]|uniref:mitogen-activated protein kinase n=1 Tax=Dissoconium aciculare CBS 342.82 TaxID=1314786 RepID=A0A6J3MEZ4_9PEZI|nr:MAP kinase [Dissoconium aciculare CBS 342.82]KAF1826199.1 MAP kinase [Dissoconium aciculare CBS 342.82]
MEDHEGERRPDLNTFDSSGTSSVAEHEEYVDVADPDGDSDNEGLSSRNFSAASTVAGDAYDEVTPLSNYSSYAWSSAAGSSNSRSAGGRLSNSMASPTSASYEVLPPLSTGNGVPTPQSRSARPGNVRQPSNAYAPARRPHQYSINTGTRPRNSSSHRLIKRNPNAEYRAQEKAYVQRIRQDVPESDLYGEIPTPSLDYDTGTESDETSPTGTNYGDYDPPEVDTLLYYGNEDVEPSIEEMKVPANRERLEWHAMLANVLTGDVVKQEKKRLIGGLEQQGADALKAEIWTGVRAKTCGRTLPHQKRLIEDGRVAATATLEDICSFAIKGEAEVGKSPLEQVHEVVKKIEKLEALYPTRQALEEAHPKAKSPAYQETCDAVISWFNTTELLNTELMILQKWVGNPELDFTKPREHPDGEEQTHIFDESSFIDRVLKEDGLKSLQGKDSLLNNLNSAIEKAKATLIANAALFAARHLPPYIEELLILINFPSRLIQEIIRLRVAYANKMRDPAFKSAVTAGAMTAEQMILQFQILLRLAVHIKGVYTKTAQPEPGWDLPPCIDDNFDSIILDALKFYFKLVDRKLSAHKNTFKEAEILEQEWEFSMQLGRQLDGGDVEVAEQFSSLTSKSMGRLAANFEQELSRPPDEVSGTGEVDKRYKALLDSVRVRQRKIFRFSRILAQKFENATEYAINIDEESFEDLLHDLKSTGHVLVDMPGDSDDDTEPETNFRPGSKMYFIASPSLKERPRAIQSMLGTCYHAEDGSDDPSNPYLLVLKPEYPIHWEGERVKAVLSTSNAEMLSNPNSLKVSVGRMRLVADGSQQRLSSAKAAFRASTRQLPLNTLVEQRANSPRVNKELGKIRQTAHQLSKTIMDSVAIVRSQIEAAGTKWTCFAFATEFGQRSAIHMDHRLTKLALDWVSFICDDCVPSDRKTFRWAVVALEFAMIMTRGQNILSISDEEYARLRLKVAGCMSLLISHFDIMGARSNLAAQAERMKLDAVNGRLKFDMAKVKDDEESAKIVRAQWLDELEKIDQLRKDKEAERQALGRVLEDSNEADRALTYLSASAGNVHLRWQQGQFVGGGTFGSVYVAVNLDSNHLMAVKEIRLQDPKMIPTIISQIRDEIGVLQGLDHPNIVQYYGIEPHRDKVYIFMEYCSRGSLASLLEYGRIEDETVIQVYALQLLEGLCYLHEAHIVHRDIKPENVLLDHNGVIKFVDFGAAKVIAKQGKTVMADRPDAKGGKQGSMQGTPMYMSPEAIKGGHQPHARLGAVDIWSLGCVIGEMATGARPWASLDNEWAIMYNIANGDSPTLPTKEQLSDSGLDFLRRCFERDPARRASAVELLQHDWIQTIKVQLSLEPGTPATPASEVSSFTSGASTYTPASSVNGDR